jgi:hypothetical protein
MLCTTTTVTDGFEVALLLPPRRFVNTERTQFYSHQVGHLIAAWPPTLVKAEGQPQHDRAALSVVQWSEQVGVLVCDGRCPQRLRGPPVGTNDSGGTSVLAPSGVTVMSDGPPRCQVRMLGA